ncbi:hypothetical protein M9H77_34454 [Catharanthus roseus]|uniref:Uncharacterized protein n=1 Tax=Catharanthus roseus TaxID=4058 RepID=A0ACB9ZMX9_CATRO|nr:hypothetical protein M9H77_34454 [Catharanthus roseus]
MAEEQKWQEPGAGHRLCINNCGFFGSPTTFNLCSKCYKDHCIKEQQMKEAKIAMENTLAVQAHHHHTESSSSSSEQLMFKSNSSDVQLINPPRADQIVLVDSLISVTAKLPSTVGIKENKSGAATATATESNRCSNCRRRVGLTGFKCKCGLIFCGTHRYPENHGCPFDYKSLGREAIAKANPVVKAEKLDKI